MLKKRGQAAIFVVIAIVLTVAAFMILYSSNQDDNRAIRAETQQTLSLEDRNVRTFVEECLDLTAKSGMFYLGFVGGRLNPDPFSDYYAFDSAYKVPYYYINSVNKIPVPYSENYWTDLLDRYIYNNFEVCINGFEQFPIDITAGNLESNTQFTDDSVIFTINYPVRTVRDSDEVTIEPRYTTTVPSRLREMLEVSTTIVEKKVKNDHYIHWDYLTQVTQRKYNATAYTENDNTIVYRLIDLQNEIDDEPFILQFAAKVTI